jgi:hypothetical protein
MPKFITIGYGDQAGYDRTPRPVRDAAHEQDAKLRSEGALMGIAGTPIQVRNPNGARTETLDGPFMSSALPIAGFAVIEAADLAAEQGSTIQALTAEALNMLFAKYGKPTVATP